MKLSKNPRFALLKVGVVFALAGACSAAGGSDWKTVLQDRLPLYGHRNWIVVADSAYPAQTASGIETVYSDGDQTEVLNFVFKALAGSRHVTPVVFTDRELNLLPENDVSGITSYRETLKSIVGDRKINALPHEKLIEKLDQVSQSFRVLIIKTKMTMPYTSVFLQLDCAYWTPEQETRLRAIAAANH
jgi:RbsD / FucU transport protein family